MNSKLILYICIVSFGFLGRAQESFFLIEAGVRYNLRDNFLASDIPIFGGPRSGPGIEITPTWCRNDNQSYGIKIGINVVYENYKTDAIGAFNFFSAVPSYRYTLTNKTVRPFVGAGFGGYTLVNAPTNLAPGLSISTGVNVADKINFSVEYDKMLTELKVDQQAWGTFENWYYLGMKLSYYFGFK